MGQYLAIDSGASFAHYFLFEDPSQPLASGSLKGANYTEEGFTGLSRFFERLHQALPAPVRLEAIGMALAGAGRSEVRERALADISRLLPRYCNHSGFYLFHDGESALRAALPGGLGIVVSAGTGSIAFGRDEEGTEARSGGWGRLVGDEGSAYWIAVRSVSAVLRAHDGRSEPTRLSERLLARLSLSNPEELVAWVHRPGQTKEEIAALAPVVDEAGEEGDPIARRILTEAGKELAPLASSILKRLHFKSLPTVACAGSVLIRSTRVRDGFRECLQALHPGLRIVSGAHPPAMGAAILLKERLERRIPPQLRS